MAREGMTEARQRRAARLVRRWLGGARVDALLGATGREDAVTTLLANHPVVTPASVQDGLDLLADKRRDHPNGLRTETVGARLALGRNIAWGAFAVCAAGLVAGALIVSGPGDPDLNVEGLADRVGVSEGLLVAPMLVTLALGVLLLWVTATWRHVLALAEVRYAVRWAADRPGQLGRGIPLVEPFSGFTAWLVGPAVLCWICGGLVVVFALWLATQPGFAVGGVLLIALALGLAGWPLFVCGRLLGRAATVANDHLLILRQHEWALRVDPATALRERFLLIVEGGTLAVAQAQERTVYPLTADLSREELRRRHDQVRQDSDTELTLIGAPGTAPLITVATPGEESGLVSYFEREYAGGWLVAVARTESDGRRAWVVVREAPQRFATEVLPLFGERSGLEPGSVSALPEPQQVPSDGEWVDGWVRERVREG